MSHGCKSNSTARSGVPVCRAISAKPMPLAKACEISKLNRTYSGSCATILLTNRWPARDAVPAKVSIVSHRSLNPLMVRRHLMVTSLPLIFHVITHRVSTRFRLSLRGNLSKDPSFHNPKISSNFLPSIWTLSLMTSSLSNGMLSWAR